MDQTESLNESDSILIQIAPEQFLDRLQGLVEIVYGEKENTSRFVVFTRFGSSVILPSVSLLSSITTEKLKEIEWYYERYATIDPFRSNRASATEKLLSQHAAELLKNFIGLTVLPNEKRKGRFVIQILSNDGPAADEASTPNFFWEILEDPAVWSEALEFTPTSISVVRTIKSRAVHLPIKPISRTSRLLVLTARLAWKDDIPHRLVARAIQEVISPVEQNEAGPEVTFVRPGTFLALRTALESQPSGHFDILHLDVHGSLNENGRAVLYFVSLERNLQIRPNPVTGEALAKLLVDHGVGTVVLNACRSAANTGTSSDLAGQLVRAGINAAVGMQYNVLSRSAESFVRKFYEHLLVGKRTLFEAVALARAELLQNRQRKTRFGHSVSLQDFLVPVVHMQGCFFEKMLGDKVSLVPETITTKDHLTSNTSPDFVIGREGDLLYLETILPELAVPCVNIHGAVGVGKSAFLNHLKRWWTITDFVQHHCFMSCSQLTGHMDRFIIDIKTAITTLRSKCASANSEEQCKHRILVIIDDIDVISLMKTTTAATQKKFRSLIRRSRNEFYTISSRAPIPWLIESLAIDYQIRQLSLGDSIDFATGLLVSQEALQDIQDDSVSQSCYEELIEICSGNPLALRVMSTHIDHVFTLLPSTNMSLIFKTFLNLGRFHLPQEDLRSWTDNKRLRSLLELLQNELSLPCPSDLPNITADWSSQAQQTRIEKHLQIDQSDINKSALILGLGAFCGCIPDNLERYATMSAAQQCIDFEESMDGLQTFQSSILLLAERAGTSEISIMEDLLQSLSTSGTDGGNSFGNYLCETSSSAVIWLSTFTDECLRDWIGNSETSMYGNSNWTWPCTRRSINPVLTLILRGLLTNAEDYEYLRAIIKCAFAISIRQQTASWMDRPDDNMVHWTSALSLHVDDEFVNHLTYLSAVENSPWTTYSDWTRCEIIRSFGPRDIRRGMILSVFGVYFIKFACGALEQSKELLLASQELEAIRASQETYNRAWQDFSSLENAALTFMVSTILYCFYNFESMDGLRSLLEKLQHKPLAIHLPIPGQKEFWLNKIKRCSMYLDAGEGKHFFSLEDDVVIMEEQLDAMRQLFGEQYGDVNRPEASASIREKLDYLDNAGNSIPRGGGANILAKVKALGQMNLEDTREGAQSVIDAAETLLAEEIQSSNDPVAKMELFKLLASQNEILENYDTAIDQQQRYLDLASSLDTETAMLYAQRDEYLQAYLLSMNDS